MLAGGADVDVLLFRYCAEAKMEEQDTVDAVHTERELAILSVFAR